MKKIVLGLMVVVSLLGYAANPTAVGVTSIEIMAEISDNGIIVEGINGRDIVLDFGNFSDGTVRRSSVEFQVSAPNTIPSRGGNNRLGFQVASTEIDLRGMKSDTILPITIDPIQDINIAKGELIGGTVTHTLSGIADASRGILKGSNLKSDKYTGGTLLRVSYDS